MGAAVWRSGAADRPQPLRCGWRLRADPADGGCRYRPPPRARSARADSGANHLLGPALPARGIPAPGIAQSVVPVVVFRRGAAAANYSALRLMRRHLILFVRAPLLGTGKRRLARDIGDVAALRFERLMLARLQHRLGRDGRWDMRLAVTPGRARHRKRLWPRGTPIVGQGRGDLGERMLHALAACPPGP